MKLLITGGTGYIGSHTVYFLSEKGYDITVFDNLNTGDVNNLPKSVRFVQGDKVSVRDKVNSKYKFDLKTTQDVINAIPQFPDKIMITIHPQRWDIKIAPYYFVEQEK